MGENAGDPDGFRSMKKLPMGLIQQPVEKDVTVKSGNVVTVG
jgi:hypothetical protein